MKTKLPQSIYRIDEAILLLTALHNNGEAFHPEDDANDLSGDPFTKEEGNKLNALMQDIYNLTGANQIDPCEWLLYLDGIVEGYEPASVKTIEQSLTGAQFEVRDIDAEGYIFSVLIKKADRNYKGNYRQAKLGEVHRFHTSHLTDGAIFYKS